MNIFIRELRANRKALIIWSVCLFLTVLSGMGKYTAYSSGGATGDVFAKMPDTMKALLGIGSFDVTKLSGFFAFLFPYIEVTVAIHAVLIGCGIIAKEERDKTTEFIIAKPVSRVTIITQKLLAALINVVIINIVTLLSSIAMVSYYSKGEDITGEILTFFLNLIIVQLIFLSLGAFLSAILRKPKTSGSIATGLLFGAYVIAKITDLTDKVNFINVFSPFKYFSLQRIVDGNGLNIIIVILSLSLVAVLTVLAYFFYQRRDLNI